MREHEGRSVPKYTIYLAISEDPRGTKFAECGAFAFELVDPSGISRTVISGDPVRLCEDDDDLHYAAIDLAASADGLLPDGAQLEVVSRQSYYHGGEGFVGTLNQSREERIQRGYTKKDGKRPLDKHERLKRLDIVLDRRSITTTGRMPTLGKERSKIELLKVRAQIVMARFDMTRDGIVPPEDY